MEFQAWLPHLRYALGQTTHTYGRRADPIRYGNLERRWELISVTNKAGQTPLHAIATTSEGNKREALQVAAWLVENGADANADDEAGNTPVHLAAASDACGGKLLQLLCVKGADTALRNRLGYTVKEVSERRRPGAALPNPPTQSLAPDRLPGCSYVSMMVEKLAMTNGEKPLRSPCLVIHVHSAKQHKVETAHTMTQPAFSRSSYLWWGWTWHMQTPIEHLSPGSFAVFELRERCLNPKTQAWEAVGLAWAVLHLDDSSIDSGAVNLEMYRFPVDLKLQRMEPASYFLSGEVLVTKAAGFSGPPLASD